MNAFTFIYVLNDPRTGEVRYVGKANNPHARFEEHCRDDTPGRNPKSHWIWGLKSIGLLPVLEVLESVPVSQWESIEREYIRVFRAAGMKLTNTADGGKHSESPTERVLTKDERKRVKHLEAWIPIVQESIAALKNPNSILFRIVVERQKESPTHSVESALALEEQSLSVYIAELQTLKPDKLTRSIHQINPDE